MNHSGDIGNGHTAHTLAMHLSGGINIRSNYAYMPFSASYLSREFHVYFSWGDQIGCDAGMDKIHSLYNIRSGYLFDHLFRLRQGGANDFGFNGNVKCVIALFDDTSHPEAHFSSKILQTFYSVLIGLAVQNENVGLVIKPKKYYIQDVKEIAPHFEKAYNEGSIVVLDRNESPYKAVIHADIAVCLGINSAGIEAALFGKRVVYWVPDAYICPQLEGANGSKLVFHDLDKLIEFLKDLAAGKTGSDSIGDHSSIISQIDPWRDGNAGRRIGEYIKDFLDVFDQSEARELALNWANERYKNNWGADKISEIQSCFECDER